LRIGVAVLAVNERVGETTPDGKAVFNVQLHVGVDTRET
jgi:hypothetical protein